MRLGLVVWTAATVLLLAPFAEAAKYYKWVDENGVVQYSSTPPKGQDTTEVKTLSPTAKARDVAVDEGAEPDPQTDPQTAAAVAAAARRQERCAAARANLRTLTTNTVVTKIDDQTKQQVALTTEQIAAERAAVNEQIAADCDTAG